MPKLSCWNCGKSVDDVPLPISRHATCSHCFNELHCCRMCRHFDPQRTGAHCDEDRADPPVVKESANFCDWFRPSAAAFSGKTTDRSDAARSRLDELFGTENSEEAPPTDEPPEDDARAQLDALFAKKEPPKNKM